MSNKKKYSLLSAIRHMSGDTIDAGFERELSKEMRKRPEFAGRSYMGGIVLPDFKLMKDAGIITDADMERAAGAETLGRPATGTLTGVGGNGSALIETSVLLANFIPGLVADTVLGKAGASHIDHLVGNIALPKGDSVEAKWIGENESGKKVNPTFSQVTGTPHTISAYTDLTRALLVQTSNAAEALVIRVLQSAIARAIDAAAFCGKGTGGEPKGLSKITGVTEIDIGEGGPTKAKLSEFWEALANANVDTSNAKWIVAPSVKGLLGKTLDITKITNNAGTETVGAVTSGTYLINNGLCEGYPVLMSGLCGAGNAWFGNWADLIIATWAAGIEINVDRFTNSTSGASRVVAISDADILCRYPEAFAFGNVIA